MKRNVHLVGSGVEWSARRDAGDFAGGEVVVELWALCKNRKCPITVIPLPRKGSPIANAVTDLRSDVRLRPKQQCSVHKLDYSERQQDVAQEMEGK